MDQERLEAIRKSILLKDIPISIKGHNPFSLKDGLNDCPLCLSEGRSGKSKLGVWESKFAKCWSSRCQWNRHRVDCIDLYMFINGMEGQGAFLRAVYELEEKAGISVEQVCQPRTQPILEEALEVYNYCLHTPESKPVLDYLQTERGWDLEVIEQIGIGYAPHSRVLRDYGLNINALIEAGLFSLEKGHEHFSRRIVFPIRNSQNRLQHLTGRYFGRLSPDGKIPKWKHTSGKVRTLIGEEKLALYKAGGEVFLSEGYPDYITLRSLGIPAVATCGLYGLINQVDKLEGMDITCCYDIDCFEPDHPYNPGEYKSWSRVIPQLIDLQYLLPKSNIYLWFLPGEGRHKKHNTLYSAKDINEFVLGSGIEGSELRDMISRQRICLVSYCINKWGQDLSRHQQLLRLCAATGKGATQLEGLIPEGMGPLEYALNVLG